MPGLAICSCAPPLEPWVCGGGSVGLIPHPHTPGGAQVAPVMHEWTYESMVYDMLPVEGNVIRCAGDARTVCGTGRCAPVVLAAASDQAVTSAQTQTHLVPNARTRSHTHVHILHRYVAEAASGRQEQKDHILDEGDETWVVRGWPCLEVFEAAASCAARVWAS